MSIHVLALLLAASALGVLMTTERNTSVTACFLINGTHFAGLAFSEMHIVFKLAFFWLVVLSTLPDRVLTMRRRMTACLVPLLGLLVESWAS